MLFFMALNFTDQGVKGIKDAPNRAKAAKELARKCGAEVKNVWLTTGDSDLLVMLEAPNGESSVKFAMALGMLGNVHTRTFRAWPEAEFQKLVSELP